LIAKAREINNAHLGNLGATIVIISPPSRRRVMLCRQFCVSQSDEGVHEEQKLALSKTEEYLKKRENSPIVSSTHSIKKITRLGVLLWCV
jgi:hypothetical protein